MVTSHFNIATRSILNFKKLLIFKFKYKVLNPEQKIGGKDSNNIRHL